MEMSREVLADLLEKLGSVGERRQKRGRLYPVAAASALVPLPWQGVRIFHDHRDDWHPGEAEYAEALELEWAASTRSPYRETARLVHTLARREAVA